MKLILQRNLETEHSTSGQLLINDVPEFYTLEPPPKPDKSCLGSVCIPTGTYPVILTRSKHFGRIMPLLQNVPGRDDIEIHWGNFPKDTDGCILVGVYRDGPDKILDSVLGFHLLFELMQRAVASVEPISITVLDPFSPQA